MRTGSSSDAFASRRSAFTPAFRLVLFLALLVSAVFSGTSSGLAIENPDTGLAKVGIKTKLGTQLNLDLQFTDDTGAKHTLRDVVGGSTPTILVPAYYHCPRLCGLVLGGVSELVNALTLKLGQDYRVVTVSFDPKDDVSSARQKAAQYHEVLTDKASGNEFWHFLVGEAPQVQELMQSIGFEYIEDRGEFAHTAAIMILTPGGEISQVFTGVQFSASDVRLALVEASKGRVGNPIDHIMLFCFRFDPTKGKYTWAAFNLVRAGGALTLLFLVGLIYTLRRREKEKLKGA